MDPIDGYSDTERTELIARMTLHARDKLLRWGREAIGGNAAADLAQEALLRHIQGRVDGLRRYKGSDRAGFEKFIRGTIDSFVSALGEAFVAGRTGEPAGGTSDSPGPASFVLSPERAPAYAMMEAEQTVQGVKRLAQVRRALAEDSRAASVVECLAKGLTPQQTQNSLGLSAKEFNNVRKRLRCAVAKVYIQYEGSDL